MIVFTVTTMMLSYILDMPPVMIYESGLGVVILEAGHHRYESFVSTSIGNPCLGTTVTRRGRDDSDITVPAAQARRHESRVGLGVPPSESAPFGV